VTNWRDAAACREEDPELFFPVGSTGREQIQQIQRAKSVCWTRCPARETCEAWARDNRISHGIWGGYTEGERLSMKRHRAGAVQGKPRFYVDAGLSWVKVGAAIAAGWSMHAIRVQTGVNSETLINLARNSTARITAESARRIAEADLSAEALQARIEAQDQARRGGQSVSA
jgi:WhiB family transcriptional regulator, redox-sensing transcriptional regulator